MAAALQLRYLQTLTEVGVNQNSTIVFPLPIDVIRRSSRARNLAPDDDPVAMTAAEETATLPAGVAASQAKTRVSLTPEFHRGG